MDRNTPFKEDWTEPLATRHDRASFSCGNTELDTYFRQQAGQDLKRKIAAIYVLIQPDGRIAGFYTLSAYSILASELPLELAKKLPRHLIPATLLGRMAVDLSFQGQGLGESLLINALERALIASRQVASWAVIVDAKAGARQFYLRNHFIPFPNHVDRLFLPIRTIEEMFER